MKSKVAVIKTKPETVINDIVNLCDMAEIYKALNPNKTTILKDNISWHFPMPGANSTPWQLEGVVEALHKFGFNDITAVENKTVVTRPAKGEKLNKYDKIYEKYNIPVFYNFKEEDMTWIKYEPKFKTNALEKVFPDGIYLPDYFFDKNIIHLPTVKCHIYTTTTGAMKNAFGGLLNTNRHRTHSWIHKTLVDLLTIQKDIHSGIFAVMDGTTCGNGPGPRTVIPVQKDIMLASDDQVAIDSVAAKLMGFDPMSIEYISLATEQGLGNGNPCDIELVGEDISNENYHFTVGDNLASTAGDILWFGPLKSIQKIFFHSPLLKLFVMASDIYHDKFWWKKYGLKIHNTWKETSPWGRLFDEY